MIIAWFCIPAHGHTNPTLGLVREVIEAGHEVYYFSFESFREKIQGAGATFISCDGCDFDMEDKENSDRVGKDIAFATELLVNATLALDNMVSKKIAEIAPDIIVSDSVAYWGKLIAKKHNIPYVSSTTTFAFNRYSAKYMESGFGEIIKMIFAIPKINKQIKRLQDKGYPVKSMIEIIQNDNDTNTIVYTSKFFQPCVDTFSDRYHFIGPIVRPVQSSMKKTAKKTVYVSMGTVNKHQAFYDNCIKAFEHTNYQVIISLGANAATYTNLPSHIQAYPTVDQMAVLEIADVFITHCGMNSVSEGLYFETPLLMFPQTPEQKAVAMRTKELGAGTELKDISPSEILSATNELLKNARYKENALKISRSFQSCGGACEARTFFESLNNKA